MKRTFFLIKILLSDFFWLTILSDVDGIYGIDKNLELAALLRLAQAFALRPLYLLVRACFSLLAAVGAIFVFCQGKLFDGRYLRCLLLRPLLSLSLLTCGYLALLQFLNRLALHAHD